MAQSQALEAQEKKELVSKEEKTVPARYYVPNTDIHETDDALVVVMEVPGVDKKDLSVDLENDVLKIGSDRFQQIRWARSPIHRIQCRPLLASIYAVEQDRSATDPCAAGRWCADIDVEEIT